MLNSDFKPIISIVIPLFNGEEFLTDTLNSIISQIDPDKVELVLCDDLSTDNTYKIAENFAQNKNIKLFKNKKNLGMDDNFEKVVSYATGEYIWFCGQDDIFGEGVIKKVLSIIKNNPKIDFIFINYSQNSHDMSEIITQKILNLDNDVLCNNPNEFYSKILDPNLGPIFPSFLPAYVLRKSLWNKGEKKPFYGTQFIQLGVFFSLITNLTMYIIAFPYIKGRVPNNKWQQDILKLLDITSGDVETFTYAYKNYKDAIPYEIYKRSFDVKRKWIINQIYRIKKEKLKLNNKLLSRFNYIFGKKDLLIIYLMYFLPLSPLFNKIFCIIKRSMKDCINLFMKSIYTVNNLK
ncbi:MAG: hypothetical protein ACD_20C00434G0009 [uncultured bacterium]|nr:MAG: hypothetical protein ACD_20C00434G0009 [uncultured bacterium]